jgi:G3E family GTPase
VAAVIEVSLVCGFLGAGKTTWLMQRLQEDAAIDTVVVNDFAAEGVDGRLLAGIADRSEAGGPQVLEIDGGCVCCDRKDELASALRAVVDRRHRGAVGDRTSTLVIETSGLAQPAPLLTLLDEDPVLRANTRLREVVVLVDGLDGARLLRHQPAVRAHLRLADRVVLTRADLVGTPALEELTDLVMALRPGIEVTWSADGVETTCVLPRTAPPVEWDDGDEGLQPRSWSVELAGGTSWAEYAWWLHATTRAHPAALLRSKGTVPTPDGPVLVQSMGPIVAAPVRLADASSQVMTFVTNGIAPEALARSLAAFVPSAGLPR